MGMVGFLRGWANPPRIGIEPPDLMKTVGFCRMSENALAAIWMAGWSGFTITAGLALRTFTSVRMPLGVFFSTNFRKAATTFSGSCLGTRRMLTLAVAFAGITVLAPTLVNPPAMP